MGAKFFIIFYCARDLKPRLILAEALVWRSAARSAEILSGSAKAVGCQVRGGRDLHFGPFGRSTAKISSPRRDVLRAVRSTHAGSKINGADLFTPGDARVLTGAHRLRLTTAVSRGTRVATSAFRAAARS
jgi:hypothetical protein